MRGLSAPRRLLVTASVLVLVLGAVVLAWIAPFRTSSAAAGPPVLRVAVTDPAWLTDVRHAAAIWNASGVKRRMQVVPAADTADVHVISRPIARSCGPRALGCFVDGVRGSTIVLPVRDDLPYFADGTGPLTIVAHELGHALGIGHHATGCTLMRPRLSLEGCSGTRADEIRLAPGCHRTRDRAALCARQALQLQLCGPTAADVARAGGPATAGGSSPATMCVRGIRALPSLRADAAEQHLSERIAEQSIQRSLANAAKQGTGSADVARICAGVDHAQLPASFRRLCPTAGSAPD